MARGLVIGVRVIKTHITQEIPPFEIAYADGTFEQVAEFDLDGGWRLVWDKEAKSPWARRGLNVHCWLEPKHD